MAFLKLIRYQNLLIIAATQYMMRLFIVGPILAVNGFVPQLDHLHFFLLVFSSMTITAAGYVINDYFDMKTDLLNRPNTVIVGRRITRRWAMVIHIILNSTGILIGVYLSWHVGMPGFGIAYILAAGLLWFYSTTYKRQFLIGNLIVSIFTAVVPFVVVIFEVPLLNKEYGEIMISMDMNFNNIIAWVGGFSFFAFLATLIREIIKDVEDFEGDAAYGRNTLPIVLGIRFTKILIITLILLMIFSLIYVYITYLSRKPEGELDLLSLLWFSLALILPFIYLIFRLIAARDRDEYHVCSNLTKLIMLAGILYSVMFYIIIQPYIP
ncbi:geranylgeranylglycerol-phosphate geranylgeranyltransferase [Bacteroidota bacterium]